MKLAIIIGILATSLILVHTEEKTDSLKQLEESIETLSDYEKSLTEKLEGILEEIKRKLDEILKDPRKRVEERAEYIKESAEEIERCIEKQKKDIPRVLKKLDSDIKRCIKIAIGRGIVLGEKIEKLIKEIANKIGDILANIEDCKKKPNIIQVQLCLFKEACNAKDIIEETIEDIKAVIGSVDEAILEIIEDLIRCIKRAENDAQSELDRIDKNICRCGCDKPWDEDSIVS